MSAPFGMLNLGRTITCQRTLEGMSSLAHLALSDSLASYLRHRHGSVLSNDDYLPVVVQTTTE
eukprot:1315085-Amphidinium_carterae.1